MPTNTWAITRIAHAGLTWNDGCRKCLDNAENAIALARRHELIGATFFADGHYCTVVRVYGVRTTESGVPLLNEGSTPSPHAP